MPIDLFTREVEGSAERTLLVVHGGPDWDHSYLVEPLIRLAGRHRLVFPDLRGCGRSPKGDLEYTPDAIVADLLALIGGSAVDVLGFSYGGLPSPRLPDGPRRLAALGVPMLLLHGRQDMVFPAALAARAERLIPSATARVLEEAGHMAHIDQPDRWLAEVQGFLDGRFSIR
ncbi:MULTISPECIES: alpha/beta fold hydrolase [Streptosporangium]|uniref:Pimeloyl-ACP methyl ester carboxylesterase n=1 Tax=Streptosporangium brasiliense TaxID=47480 RepID=A0ABT9QW21_9ACTN|nr:alpha/beta fold hydrolase [Streptosporangium brasiliense]MDP9860857.1 pimeloyl-ACP methyl ester carboxylesterase [Streptosporangium brasiliense]